MSDPSEPADMLGLTAQIVAAHVSHNSVPPEQLPALIHEIYQTLASIGQAPEQRSTPQPAVPVTKTIFADYLVCLEDGRRLKMLKRHLHTAYGMTPDQYRERWGLARDYPMVAPNYARQRSSLARKIGLGKRTRRTDPS